MIASVIASFLVHPIAAMPTEDEAPYLQRDLWNAYSLYRLRLENVKTPSGEVVYRAWSLSSVPRTLYYDYSAYPLQANAWDQAYLRKAYGHFRYALKLTRQLEHELARLNTEHRSIEDPTWWKEEERNDARMRKVAVLRKRYAINLKDSYTRIFDDLEMIRATSIRESKSFTDLDRISTRMYIIYAVELDMCPAAMGAMDRYTHFPDADREWPLHFFYYSCFARLYRVATKNSATPEDELLRLRRWKNLHLLQAVELRYGSDSMEYETALKRSMSEEMASP